MVLKHERSLFMGRAFWIFQSLSFHKETLDYKMHIVVCPISLHSDMLKTAIDYWFWWCKCTGWSHCVILLLQVLSKPITNTKMTYEMTLILGAKKKMNWNFLAFSFPSSDVSLNSEPGACVTGAALTGSGCPCSSGDHWQCEAHGTHTEYFNPGNAGFL